MSIRRLTTTIKSAAIITVMTLACVVIAAVDLCYAAGDSAIDHLSYRTQNGEEIWVQNIDENRYLFLPADADIHNFTLASSDEGVKVSFADPETDTLSETIDLEACDMTDEGSYQLTVHMDREGEPSSEESLNVMQGSAIGTVYYHSDDPVNEGIEYVDASKSNKPSGYARILNADNEVVYDGTVTEIHARGNSTFIHYPKKAYQIKLGNKTALIDGTKKGKTWVLLAIYVDPLRMTDKIAKDIAAEVGQRFAAKEDWVDLYYDGEYRGIYLLSEKNQLNSNRIDLNDMEDEYKELDPSYGDTEKIETAVNSQGNRYYYQADLPDLGQTGGYLIELNENKGDELNWFEIDAKYPEMRRGVNIISPELGSKGDVRYISEYFQGFQRALDATDSKGNRTGKDPVTGLYYYDYCDLDSLVDEYLIQTIASNGDSFFKSSYFYKDKDGKLYAGPVWDFDQSFGIGWDYGVDSNLDFNRVSVNWGSELIEIPSFKRRVCERYKEVYQDILQSLIDGKGPVESVSQRTERLQNSLKMDHVMWPAMLKSASPFAGYEIHTEEEYKKAGYEQRFSLWPEGTTFEEIAKDREAWIARHKAFLDNYFAGNESGEVHVMTDEVTPLTDTTHERTCSYCGEHFTEECTFTGIASEDSETHTLVCTVCGNTKAETQPCKYETIEETAPKANAAGSRTSFCSICGREKHETVTLDKGEKFKKTYTYKVSKKDKTVTLVEGANKKTVVVPATVSYGGVVYRVTAIGSKAFLNKKSVRTLRLGSNVASIGKSAFKGCTRLKLVKSTKALKTIGSKAFYGNTALKKITTLRGCGKIGSLAFYKCRSLKTIGSKSGRAQLKKKVKIGKRAFYRSGIKGRNIRRIL